MWLRRTPRPTRAYNGLVTGAPDSAWSARLYQSVPLAPVWLSVGIALGLLGLFLILAWAFGGLDIFRAGDQALWEYREVRIAFLVASLVGYLPTARHYVAAGARKNGQDLRPLLGPAQRLEPPDARASRTAGFLGLLFVPFTAFLLDRDPTLYLQRAYWGAETSFGWVVGALACRSFGLFVYDTLAYARGFSDLGRRLERIDLLDPRALAPFARQGLRSALLWLILISLFSLNAFDFTWFAATGVIALLGGTTALILPVYGIHQRLGEAKQAELERVHAAIRGEPEGLAGSPLAERAASLGLADLLAYRKFVESVREWPFDSPSLLRFALYLGIPLGSWLGGAFVERLLGVALD